MVYASSSVVCCIPVYFWWAWMHNPVIMKQHPVWYTGYASFLGGQSNLTKEENALKAKLRRLCERKQNGECKVPDWLHEQWKKSDHLEMALRYQQCGFDQDDNIIQHQFF